MNRRVVKRMVPSALPLQRNAVKDLIAHISSSRPLLLQPPIRRRFTSHHPIHLRGPQRSSAHPLTLTSLHPIPKDHHLEPYVIPPLTSSKTWGSFLARKLISPWHDVRAWRTSGSTGVAWGWRAGSMMKMQVNLKWGWNAYAG
jgi:hypothetical protein